MPGYDGEAPVPELAVPAILTAPGCTAGIHNGDHIFTAGDLKIHFPGIGLHDMPGKSPAAVKIRLSQLFARITGKSRQKYHKH